MKKKLLWSNRNTIIFKSNVLNCLNHEIEIGVIFIKSIIKYHEERIVSLNEDLRNNINSDEIYNSLDDDLKLSYVDQIDKIEEQIINEYQRNQKNFIINLIYSFLESNLFMLFERKNIEGVNQQKKSNEILTKYWASLKEKYPNNLDKVKPYFTKLKNQKIVRNKIIHQGGLLERKDKSKINDAKGLDLIEKSASLYEIRIVDDYYFYILDALQLFFKELFISIDNFDDCEV